MAQVFRVRYRGHPFALKLLLHETPSVRQRLDREAKLVGSLQHPGIVTLQGAGAVEGRTFLLYDLIPKARTLSSAWAELSVQARVELIAQIADAVGFAHTRGIVHRDLKPENVLVDESGQPKVIDFGLAKQAGMERLTQSGMQLGTQAYMAPEQFSTDDDLQRPAIDVWSLGVLLYEALTERMPFHAQGVAELRGKLQGSPPPSPRAVNPGVSRALEAVCFRALSSEQSDRQPNGIVFASELRAAIVQGPDTSELRPGRARRIAWVALALGAVALAAWWWGTGGDANASATAPTHTIPNPAQGELEQPYRLLEQGLAVEALLARARKQLGRDPADVTAQVAEAAAFTLLGDNDAARDLALGVLEEHPQHLPALHVLTRAHYQANRFSEALEACERAQAIDPFVEFSWVYTSLIACTQGEFERCIALADEALGRSADSAALWSARGMARLGLNQLAEALQDFNASLARVEDPNTRINRATVFLRVGRMAEALEDLEAVQGNARASRMWTVTRIQCLLTLDRARAVEEARTFQAQWPDRADANFFLGEALRRQGEQGARAYLERAVSLERGSGWSNAAKRTLEGLKR